MRRNKRYFRRKGYHAPGLFAGRSPQRQFSNRRLFLTLTLVAGGIALMIWGLTYAKGAM